MQDAARDDVGTDEANAFGLVYKKAAFLDNKPDQICTQTLLRTHEARNIMAAFQTDDQSTVPCISLHDFDQRRAEIIEQLMDASTRIGFL